MTTEDDASGPGAPHADAAARAEEFLDRLEANGRIADEVRRLLVQSARLVVHEFNTLAGDDGDFLPPRVSVKPTTSAIRTRKESKNLPGAR